MPHQTFDRSVPRWKQLLAVMLKKSGRNHKKRHGTNKEKAEIRARKQKESKAKITANNAAFRAYKTAMRQYWRGERDTAPTLPKRSV